MVRTVGTVARGIRLPIIKSGDDLVNIVVQAVKTSAETEGYQLRDHDVVGITESAVARAQGNYVTLDDIALDVRRKFNGNEEFGIIFPILSRNRFSIILKGIARAAKKLYLQLGYPADEVGNHLMPIEKWMNWVLTLIQIFLLKKNTGNYLGKTLSILLRAWIMCRCIVNWWKQKGLNWKLS